MFWLKMTFTLAALAIALLLSAEVAKCSTPSAVPWLRRASLASLGGALFAINAAVWSV